MSEVNHYVIESLQRYVNDRIPPGGFLLAVLSNDLRGACERADQENQRALFEIVKYVYNYVPGVAWGSPERVDEWLGGTS